jgi:hypothetical protein
MTETTTDQQRAHLRRLAATYGLEKLLELDPEAFAAAFAAAKGLSERTDRPTTIADEPAHTCRFANRGART